ncbi:ATP-binding protein [Thermocrinis sp.]|uniref:ATP-binding protein n=1 Tax=Thermocrinis sp. TaxID=2024383 RepID=UPI002FDE0E28
MFEEFLAFRFKDGKIQPIAHPHIPDFKSLLCIDRQKEELKRNTLQFVMGYPANDALLWGDRGTGKSSLVKSMLGLLGKDGLRLVQVYKSQLEHLSDLYEAIRGSKKRFILFFDDLSFEPEEDEYRLLKSLLDGDLEERPQNVLVYATSNRRHMVADREKQGRFPEEDYREVISLVERFGLRLGFYAFDKNQYLEIVKAYAKDIMEEINYSDLEEKALLWATERGSFSGRTAYQFIKDLEGYLRLSQTFR